MENTPPVQESEGEGSGSPMASNKRPAPLLKDATKCTRKKSKSEHVHLPSNDVRSNYHLIFETIFNGCQKSVATRHFKTICTEDCAMVSRSVNNPFGPNYREVRGIDSMVEYVDTALEAIPDCIFKITDSKFFRKPQNESVIIASYTTNGRMIYTLDTLNSEDVEDIDSAISGLQMLYQGSCGSEGTEAAVQLVCQQVESAVSKIEQSSTHKNNIGASKSADSLYAFVYPTAAHPASVSTHISSNTTASASAASSAVSTSASAPAAAQYSGLSNTLSASSRPPPLPISALADVAAAAQSIPTPQNANNSNNNTPPPVQPFDYSLKFSQSGASLFQPTAPHSDDEEDLLPSGLKASIRAAVGTSSSATPSAAAAGAIAATNAGAAGTTLGDSDAGLRTLSSASADVSIKEETSGEASTVLRASASTGTLNSADSSGHVAAAGLIGATPVSLPAERDNTSNSSAHSSGLALSDLNAVKEAFWLKHRSNVMIVKEQAKFCLKEKIPPGRQVYKVKGTLTLHINSDKKVRKIELLHSFDTSMHK